VTLHPDGTFVYDNDGSIARSDSFTYTAHTPLASSAPATVFIDITGNGGNCNGGTVIPTKAATSDLFACDDSYTIPCNCTLFVPSFPLLLYPSILANDHIPGIVEEGFFVQQLTDPDPDLGQVEFFSTFNGQFEFSPRCADSGPPAKVLRQARFDYRFVYEGIPSNHATIRIDITPPSECPIGGR
jgi:hypothetical protein